VLLKGEALMASYTIQFAAHGQPGEWVLNVKAPGPLTLERETKDPTPYATLDEMLTEALAACNRRPAGARR
jgi:hypothetical protein